MSSCLRAQELIIANLIGDNVPAWRELDVLNEPWMRAARNMPNNVASERRENMVNVNHRIGSLENLKPIVKQSGFTGDSVFDAAYALTREESLKRLSPLAV